MIRGVLLAMLMVSAVAAALLASRLSSAPPRQFADAIATTARPPRLVAGDWQPNVVVLLIQPPPAAVPGSLDRIAHAVEGAELSFGRDPSMWRPDPNQPQGPMQIAPAAALDVGGGDRFDPPENRALGRAYLALMHERYGDWRDTVLAYNWGPGNVDRWIAAGRPADRLSSGVMRYVERVLNDGGGTVSSAPPPASPSPVVLAAVNFAPALPDLSEDSIGDPHLRREVVDNNGMLEKLRAFLDASSPARPAGSGYTDQTAAWLRTVGIDPPLLASGDARVHEKLEHAGAELVFAIARSVARRPGDANFVLANSAEKLPGLDATRLIASVLAQNLAEANATLALIDARGHAVNTRRSLAKARKTRLVNG